MSFQLAQLNIARLLHPLDHPDIPEFVDGLDRINKHAENSEGFVWRLQSDSGNATDITQHPWSEDPFVLVNMSVWETPEHLRQFVYRSEHLKYYSRRADWFEKPGAHHYVLWWVPEGHIPSLAEAHTRLEHYGRNGPSPYAFSFGTQFPAPSVAAASA